MSKQQLIEAIRRHNRSASEDFLTGFDESALNTYLDHLQFGRGNRQTHAEWIRPGETSAVVTRSH